MTSKAGGKAKEAGDSKSLKVLARVGLVAYGVVHLLVAWLAMQVAWGGSGGDEQTDQSGALQTLAEQPFGRGLLWVVALGLVALALWQASESIWGYRDREGAKGIRKQVTSGGKGVVYAALGVSAARIALGSGSSGSEEQETTSGVLGLPGGQFIVVVVGLIMVGVAVSHVVRGVKKSFLKEISIASVPAEARRTVTRLGQVGYLAKGIALGLVGTLLCYAGLTFDPEESQGLDGALQLVVEQPFGRFLLTAVALGIAAFGLFALAQARYRAM
ncbi:DUF1206 domain-containing protein [soil metagenome]